MVTKVSETKMDPRVKDIRGQRFGKLVVVERAGSVTFGDGIQKHAQWRCKCDCGGELLAITGKLVRKQKLSCGCEPHPHNRMGRLNHGATKNKARPRTYRIWMGMIRRCKYQTFADWKKYNALGFEPEWAEYAVFLEDVGECPDEKQSLDRIDTMKGYFRGNVRWATATTQCRNRTTNRWLDANGERKTIAEWCEIKGLSRMTITNRIALGWTAEEAVNTPKIKRPLADKTRGLEAEDSTITG